MTSTNYSSGGSVDSYHSTLASGFLTPPTTSEGRRDSVASAQSSYCSSFASEYSLPETPICRATSPREHEFIDPTVYDISPGWHQQTHGLSSVQKDSESQYDQWLMISQVNAPAPLHSISFESHGILPSQEELCVSLSDYSGTADMSGGSYSSTGSTWDPMSSITQQTRSLYDHHLDRLDRRNPQTTISIMDGLPSVWEPSFVTRVSHFHGLPSETIVPSDALMEDYELIQSDGMDVSSSFADYGASFPQSPQEVAFKREESVLPKMEEDEELSARFRNRVNVSTTGGKSVKRENRGAGLRKKSSKSGGVMAKGMLGDTMIEYSVDPHERDPTTGKCFRPGGPTTQAHQCTYRERNGRLCTRRFMRLEHLRRHEQVHTGQTDFKCVICPRAFNRNDNRQAHYDTHIRKEGKKDGRNPKMSLRELEAMLIEKDPNGCSRLIEKLRLKHGHGYCANRKRKVAL